MTDERMSWNYRIIRYRDGNYGLQRFLEAEGAEPEIQLVTAWLLDMIWQPGRF